jgi:hypothetical protein
MSLPGENKFLIDRHKIGACVIKAIAFTKPLAVEHGTKTINSRLANETLAFQAGIAVVQSFRKKECFEEGDLIGANAATKFHLPKTGDGLDYPLHIYRAIYHAQKHDIFEPFVWANQLFVLEQYSILKSSV